MTIHNLILAHASQVIPALMFTVLAVGIVMQEVKKLRKQR